MLPSISFPFFPNHSHIPATKHRNNSRQRETSRTGTNGDCDCGQLLNSQESVNKYIMPDLESKRITNKRKRLFEYLMLEARTCNCSVVFVTDLTWPQRIFCDKQTSSTKGLVCFFLRKNYKTPLFHNLEIKFNQSKQHGSEHDDSCHKRQTK